MAKRLFLVLALVAFLSLAGVVRAATLTLTRIGTLSTAGLSYTTWSVTGESPDLAGTASPSAVVSITVNSLVATTSASALSGVWVFKPNNIVSGTNTVAISSGSESMTFLLNYTPQATPTATATPVATAASLPETGNSWTPLLLVFSGVVVFILGKTYKDKVSEEWNI